MSKSLSEKQEVEFDAKLRQALDDGWGYAKVLVENYRIVFIIGESSVKVGKVGKNRRRGRE